MSGPVRTTEPVVRGAPPHRVTGWLERSFGDPSDPANPFSYARGVAADERDEFPDQVCRRLDEIGLPRFYVPRRLGGELHTLDELLQLIRSLSRRDLTVAIAHAKTYLGAVPVWLAGSDRQAGWLAQEVLAGAVVSFAITERAHGSDLLAGDVIAVPAPESGAYRITGEKWLINNATRADIICVLCRTRPTGGGRGFTLFLVDKRRLAPGSYACLPREPTVGVRGADISGITFTGAEVPDDAVVAAPGAGLEIVLSAFQVTRTLCAGMSLGLGDQALRVVTGFARSHRMYGRALIDLPHAGRTLAEAYADLLLVEAVGLLATRGIHSLPGELSISSAVVKYLVPTIVDELIASLSQVLGARALLLRDYADGQFQKVVRDHRIVGIFDGNTSVNLNALIHQFPALVRGYGRGTVDPGLVVAAGAAADLPELDRRRLSVLSRAGCSVVQGLPATIDAMANASDPSHPDLLGQAKELLEVLVDLHARMADCPRSAHDLPADAYLLARQYSLGYAAAATLHLWWYSRTCPAGRSAAWRDARWVRACLARTLTRLRPGHGDGDDPVMDELLPTLRQQDEENQLFSLWTCPLPGGGR